MYPRNKKLHSKGLLLYLSCRRLVHDDTRAERSLVPQPFIASLYDHYDVLLWMLTRRPVGSVPPLLSPVRTD